MLESGISMIKLEMDIAFSRMEVNIEGSKLKGFFMDKECIGGLKKKDQSKEIIIKERGSMEKCMDKVNLNIKMAIQLKEHL